MLVLALCLVYILAVWRRGNGIGRINEVTLRWARLVLGWVTVFGRQTTSVYNEPARLTGWEMSAGQSAVMLCGWGVKAGMSHSIMQTNVRSSTVW